MAGVRPDEKSEVNIATPHKQKGFFSKKKRTSALDDKINEKGGNITTEVKPTVPELPPVSFSQLFRPVNSFSAFCIQYLPFDGLTRYSTKFELCINALGLLAAATAGAAQVSQISLARGEF